MVTKIDLASITFDQLLPRVRLDKDIVLYTKATPLKFDMKDIRPFRASGIHRMCPVEAAYVIKLIKAKKKKKLKAWQESKRLPAHLAPIVDTGTVVHKQLQYYAGLCKKIRKAVWRCASCGFLTARDVPLPMVEVTDPKSGLAHTYPAPCQKCNGANLQEFPPWLYVEPKLLEKVKGIPKQLKVQGSIDGQWEVRVRVGDFFVWVSLIIDYKTINMNGFAGNYGKGLPQDAHVSQMQTYLNLADVEFGLIIYYCKNDSKQKYFFVRRNKSFWEELLPKVKWARKGVITKKKKEEHRVCPNIGCPRSRECFFQEKCWGVKAPENFLS